MLKETSGHILKVGDRVKMNIAVIAEEDMDGIEFTITGKNYWRYMCEHPDEVYTVTAIDPDYNDAPYFLSGYMHDNNWSSDELILVPAPTTRFELIKNMTLDEMVKDLVPMLAELCEDGLPTENTVREWLTSKEEESPAQ